MKTIGTLLLLFCLCLGCRADKQTIKISATDSPAKPGSELVTASYEVEIK